MNKKSRFSQEVKERAVRMVLEHRQDYPSLWSAVESIAPKIGCVPSTLLEWVHWFNHHRLLSSIGYCPPAEAEANYYGQLKAEAVAD